MTGYKSFFLSPTAAHGNQSAQDATKAQALFATLALFGLFFWLHERLFHFFFANQKHILKKC
jgi:flagellar biogenesis protein FliO